MVDQADPQEVTFLHEGSMITRPVLRSFPMIWPCCYDLYDQGYVVEIDGQLHVVAVLNGHVARLMTWQELDGYTLELNRAWFELKDVLSMFQSNGD